MKKIILLLAILAVILLAGCQPSPNQSSISSQGQQLGVKPTIDIKNFAFDPNSLTVKAGTTVTWTNQDSAPHKILGSGFESGDLSKGQTFSYTFNDKGKFDYSCSIHPSMKGKVIVE